MKYKGYKGKVEFDDEAGIFYGKAQGGGAQWRSYAGRRLPD